MVAGDFRLTVTLRHIGTVLATELQARRGVALDFEARPVNFDQFASPLALDLINGKSCKRHAGYAASHDRMQSPSPFLPLLPVQPSEKRQTAILFQERQASRIPVHSRCKPYTCGV